MCGIVGMVRLDGTAASRNELARMVATLEHRGPDGNGMYTEGPVGLGHTRLAIIDLAGGDQPMKSADGRTVVVFNGEIYNHRELRRELEPDAQFQTRCDTEVLVHGYRAYGEELVDRLLGFFAFAIWDTKRKSLFLARDRIGKKPLYFAQTADALLFASEPRAILAAWKGTPAPDAKGLEEILAVRHTLGRRTAFEGISQLLPGECLHLEDGEVRTRRYWKTPTPEPDEALDEGAAQERYRELFDEAVRCRLESDVPLGVMLSGGNDSTCVLEAMSRCASGTIQTFTVGFTRAKESEAEFAQTAADHFGTKHEEILLEERDLLEYLEKLLPALDTPMADPSILPTALVAKVARRHVTVCLTGDGGDELFGGYNRYVETLARAAQPGPSSLSLKLMNATLPHLPRHKLKGWKIARGFRRRMMSPEELYVDSLGCVSAADRAALGGSRSGFAASGNAIERALGDAMRGEGELTARMMSLDFEHYLPGLILHKVDRASMLNSLEARSPFLDHRLIEWSQQLPLRFKLGAEGQKLIVKRSLLGRIPGELLTRKKMGFGTPLGRWFRHELAEYLGDHLHSSRLAADGWLDQTELDRVLSAHKRRARNWGEALWALLTLEVWYRRWIAPR